MKTTHQIELDTRLTEELIKMVPVATGLMTIVGITILGWWVTLAINLLRAVL